MPFQRDQLTRIFEVLGVPNRELFVFFGIEISGLIYSYEGVLLTSVRDLQANAGRSSI